MRHAASSCDLARPIGRFLPIELAPGDPRGVFFGVEALWLTEGFFKLRGRQSGGKAGHVPADPFKPGGSG